MQVFLFKHYFLSMFTLFSKFKFLKVMSGFIKQYLEEIWYKTVPV